MSSSDTKSPELLPPALPFLFRLKDGRECLIRAITEADAEAFCKPIPETVLERAFLNYMPGEFKMTVEEESEFIRGHNAKPVSMTLAAEIDGRTIGYAGAAGLNRKRYTHHAEFGLAVVKEFWGQGLGRKLTEYAIEWGCAVGLRKLYLKVFDSNTRAVKLYQSLGFVAEARLKSDWLRADGTYGDTIIMAKFHVD